MLPKFPNRFLDESVSFGDRIDLTSKELIVTAHCPKCTTNSDKTCSRVVSPVKLAMFLSTGKLIPIHSDLPINMLEGLLELAKQLEMKIVFIQCEAIFDVWVPENSIDIFLG